MNFLLHLDQSRTISGGGYIAMRRFARALREAGHTVVESAEHRLQTAGKAQAEQYNELLLRDTAVLLTSAATRTRIVRRQARARRIPIVAFVHSALSIDRRLDADLVVWGSAALRSYWQRHSSGAVPSSQEAPNWKEAIIWPLIYPEDVRVREQIDSRITLVNLQPEKGSRIFWEMARRAPDLQFLGVRGWGTQDVPSSIPPNCEILPWISDPRMIYERTKVLLYMKGEGSSKAWLNGVGLTALEAACSGIPTVAFTGKGLLESLKGCAAWVPTFDPENWLDTIRQVLLVYPSWSASALEKAEKLPTPRSQALYFLQKVREIL